jgi:hypothetical protein
MTTGLPLLDAIEQLPPLPNIHCKGGTFNIAFDIERLGDQLRMVHDVACGNGWKTLREIQAAIMTQYGRDCETTAISARLRDFNNDEYLQRFFRMRSERVPGAEKKGLWRYELTRRPP